jgi:hypothetical protein
MKHTPIIDELGPSASIVGGVGEEPPNLMKGMAAIGISMNEGTGVKPAAPGPDITSLVTGFKPSPTV